MWQLQTNISYLSMFQDPWIHNYISEHLQLDTHNVLCDMNSMHGFWHQEVEKKNIALPSFVKATGKIISGGNEL